MSLYVVWLYKMNEKVVSGSTEVADDLCFFQLMDLTKIQKLYSNLNMTKTFIMSFLHNMFKKQYTNHIPLVCECLSVHYTQTGDPA